MKNQLGKVNSILMKDAGKKKPSASKKVEKTSPHINK